MFNRKKKVFWIVAAAVAVVIISSIIKIRGGGDSIYEGEAEAWEQTAESGSESMNFSEIEADADGNISFWGDGRKITITPEMCGEIDGGPEPEFSSAYYGFISDLDGYIVAMSPPALGTVWHWIFLTHDGGETWVEAGNANDIYAHPVNCAGMSGDGNIILGFYHGWDGLEANILISEDSGATWREPEFTGADSLGMQLSLLNPVSLGFDGIYGELRYDIRDPDGGEYSGQVLFVTYDGGMSWELD